jgi:uncharacterized protein YegL
MFDSIPVLEGNIVRRSLQFFWIVDHSGSMTGQKIATLNQAIREAIPEVQKALSTHPEVQIMMRAIKFADNVSWHVGPEAVPIEDFDWHELDAGGCTATAGAINLLCDELEVEKMNRRGYPPICILLSDGYSTDSEEEYEAAIKGLDDMPWGKKAVRLVIAIGNENDYDESALLKFVNHKEIGVLKANNPGKLTQYIKWASVAASIGASQSKSTGDPDEIDDSTNVILTSPEDIDISSAGDVF